MMLEIEQLILRIPNVSPEEGRQMSQQIVERLADQLQGHSKSIQVEQLHLRIRLTDSMSNNQMVNQISGAILNRINNIQSTSGTKHSINNFLTSNNGSH